jgi:hypothetical protein
MSAAGVALEPRQRMVGVGTNAHSHPVVDLRQEPRFVSSVVTGYRS